MKNRIRILKPLGAISLLAAAFLIAGCNNSKDNSKTSIEQTDTIINPPVNTNNVDTPLKPVDTLTHRDTLH